MQQSEDPQLEINGVGLFSQKYIDNIDNIDWEYISKNHKLTEKFIRDNQDLVDWWYISSCQKISENFIKEFEDRVDWNSISKYQNLGIEFLKEYKDKVNWEYITIYQLKNHDFIREFRKYLDWSRISEYHFLSEDFIREFRYNIDWRKIKKYIKNSHTKIYYSTEFIKEFSPYFNELYIYNHSANIIREAWIKYMYKPGNIGYLKSIEQYKDEFSEFIKINT